MASVFKRNGTGRYRVKFRVGENWQTITAYTDVRASEEMARKLEKLVSLRAERAALGDDIAKWLDGLPTRIREQLARWELIDRQAMASTRPLKNHLADYKQALLDGVASSRLKGPATEQHTELVSKRIDTLLDGIGATHLTDVTPELVGRYLAERRARGLSVQSSNHYVRAAKAFFAWLVRAKRATTNPLTELGVAQVTYKARKHIRRALEPEEAARLLDATLNGPERNVMPALARYWLYRLALETGLRSSELRALTRANAELSGEEPFVWLAGDDTKNRKPAELPLRPETAAELAVYIRDKLPSARLFPNMPAISHVSHMLRADLAAAEIPYETDSGRLDFHALRVSALSWLANAGTPLKVLQDFARHSTPTLTMNVYARTLRGSLAEAAARLPELGQGFEATRATGTFDAQPTVAHRVIGSKSSKMSPESTPNKAHCNSSQCAIGHDKRARFQTVDQSASSGFSAEKQRISAHQDAQNDRRRRDSNPRHGFPCNGFQDRRLKPLGHSSLCRYIEPRVAIPFAVSTHSIVGRATGENSEHPS